MTNDTLEKQTNRIADAIVELVERTDGPVTLAQVEREVPGFAGHAPPFFDHVVRRAGRDTSRWYDMSEAGVGALSESYEGAEGCHSVRELAAIRPGRPFYR